MALPIITNTVRTAVSGTTPNNGAWANILHFRKTSGVVDAAALNLLQAALVKLYTGPAYGTGLTHGLLGKCKTTCLWSRLAFTPLDGSSASTFVSISGTGFLTDDSLPDEVALVISLHSGARGRSYRGRMYLPPYTEAANVNGRFDSSQVTAISDQLVGFATDIATSNWEHVIASYKLATATKVLSYSIDTVWDSQRRRKA